MVLTSITGALLAWTAFTSAGAEFLATSALKVDLLGPRPKAFSNPRIGAAHAIYAGPFLPGLYYLLKKNNPFFVSETVVCNDDCQRQLVAQLSQVKPELAFLDYEMVAHLDYPADRAGRHLPPRPLHGMPRPRGNDGAGHRAGVVPLIQALSGLGMMRTGQGACWTTRAVLLPRIAWARPLRPWVPMMMRSADVARARSTIS